MKLRSAHHKCVNIWSANGAESKGVESSGASDCQSNSTKDLPARNTAAERMMSRCRDNAVPLWIDEEQEWPVSEEDYPPDGTVEL
jgi:hypothetical protein